MKIVFPALEALQAGIAFKDFSISPNTGKENIPMIQWLSRLRLLQGVPFAYLAPHAEFLAHESIRFFYINRNWTDRAVEGALSVGAISSQDRVLLQQIYKTLRDKIDQYERRNASQERGFKETKGKAEVLSGFLLRSNAVSGWPGIHVRGFRANGDEIELLRMERLAPAVLFVIMDGVPDEVQIDEPRQGIQFGVRPSSASNPNQRKIPLRDPETGEKSLKAEATIPFRKGSPGVIDINALSKTIIEESNRFPDIDVGATLDSAELALQLLRYPYRQTFGKTNDAHSDVFKPTLGIKDLMARN